MKLLFLDFFSFFVGWGGGGGWGWGGVLFVWLFVLKNTNPFRLEIPTAWNLQREEPF